MIPFILLNQNRRPTGGFGGYSSAALTTVADRQSRRLARRIAAAMAVIVVTAGVIIGLAYQSSDRANWKPYTAAQVQATHPHGASAVPAGITSPTQRVWVSSDGAVRDFDPVLSPAGTVALAIAILAVFAAIVGVVLYAILDDQLRP